jgi:DNA recombination protein RmuC
MTEQWLVALAAGIGLGWLLGWLFGARKATRLEVQLEESENRLAEERSLLQSAKEKLSDTFKSLAADALRQNNEGFLTLATEKLAAARSEAAGDLEARKTAIETLVKPLAESLENMERQIQTIEGARREAYGSLTEQVKSLVTTQESLRSETANLAKALRSPAVRGRWGEIQLKRVVELAGMLDRCDFYRQESVDTEGGRVRPDLRVQLPGGKNIVVDAKVPLQAYLEALEAPTEERRAAKLKEHAQQVRSHMNQLSAKAYWDHLQPTPEFVILFLPGETFFSAALEQDPSLIEQGVNQRVILATPTTLIALLRAVAYGWRQEQIAENAQRISDLGQELHERLATMVEHLARLGMSLGRSIEAFNSAVGSFETRVLPKARQFKELGVANTKEITELDPIDRVPRALPELPIAVGAGSKPD